MQYIVNQTILPLLLKPDPNSETADEVLYGTIVEALEVMTDYVQVRTPNAYTGYCPVSGLTKIAAAEAAPWHWPAATGTNDYQIIGSAVDVMAEPKYASAVKITFLQGTKAVVTGQTEGVWTALKLIDGSTGWVRSQYVKPWFCQRQLAGAIDPQVERSFRTEVVENALSYLGVQYRWGGKSHLGIDCSGLSSMAYGLAGAQLLRDADMQEVELRSIARQEAKAGDLLFFPGHVAVYLGDGEYVHATAREGYVLINSLRPESPIYREEHDQTLTSIGTLF